MPAKLLSRILAMKSASIAVVSADIKGTASRLHIMRMLICVFAVIYGIRLFSGYVAHYATACTVVWLHS